MGKIMVSGEGGQGVRLIAHAMATLLANLGYQVTLLYDYDSAVRGAMSLAHVTFDKNPIDNPVIDDADILLELSDKVQGLHAAKTICEAGLCSEEAIPFGQLGVEHFGREIFGNMVALGHLLALMDLEVSDEELAEALPIRYRQENINAVHFGYHLKEEDLHRGAKSRKKHHSRFSSERPGEIHPEDNHLRSS